LLDAREPPSARLRPAGPRAWIDTLSVEVPAVSARVSPARVTGRATTFGYDFVQLVDRHLLVRAPDLEFDEADFRRADVGALLASFRGSLAERTAQSGRPPSALHEHRGHV